VSILDSLRDASEETVLCTFRPASPSASDRREADVPQAVALEVVALESVAIL